MKKEKEYEIVINGTPVEVDDETLSYWELVKLAFPDATEDPNAPHLIAFEGAKSKPHEGTLVAGQSVTVKKHKTMFDVSPTNRS